METPVKLDDGQTTILEQWGTRGPCVICVHGITSSRKAWVRTAKALEAEHRVFAYDQRGHGDSAAVRGPMTLEQSVDDLHAIAARIGEPAAIIGHSWGGAVAVLGGLQPFATRVVAIDPMIYVVPSSWRSEYLDDTEADLALEREELERQVRARLTSWHESDIVGKMHAVANMEAGTIARLGSDNNVDAGGWDLRTVIQDYPKPLLVLVAGPGESVLSEKDLELIRARGGPHVTVDIFADQGHNLHRTAFDRYIAATRRFLAKQT